MAVAVTRGAAVWVAVVAGAAAAPYPDPYLQQGHVSFAVDVAEPALDDIAAVCMRGDQHSSFIAGFEFLEFDYLVLGWRASWPFEGLAVFIKVSGGPVVARLPADSGATMAIMAVSVVTASRRIHPVWLSGTLGWRGMA